MIDSRKTLASLLKLLKRNNFDSIYIYVTHIVRYRDELEDNLKEALSDCRIKKIYTTSERKGFFGKKLIYVDCSKIVQNYF